METRMKVEIRLIREEVLNPLATSSVKTVEPAERLGDLKEKTIALIDNTKPNADVILDVVREVLAEEGVKGFPYHKKPAAAVPPPEGIERCTREADAAVMALADCGSCTSWLVMDAIALEKEGIPTASVCSNYFSDLASSIGAAHGASHLPLIEIEHPVVKRSREWLRLNIPTRDLIEALTIVPKMRERRFAGAGIERNEELVEIPVIGGYPTITIEPDREAVNRWLYGHSATDGLPVFPPTRRAVDSLLRYTDLRPEEVVARIPPLNGEATVDLIAINAVMAGILPGTFPFVLKGVEALSDPALNLHALSTTTHPVALALICNGPLTEELTINSNAGCLGPGPKANATIGRAINLCVRNIGGALPGIIDRSTMGSPAKYTYCFSETRDSPWEPFHVARGFPPEASTITVLGVEAPQNVNQHRAKDGEALLRTIAHTMAVPGCNCAHLPGEELLIIGPEHAELLARGGWDKEKIAEYLYEHVRVPAELADKGGTPLDRACIDENGYIPILRSPKDALIVVSGGPGRHSMIAHSFGKDTRGVTRAITFRDGSIVKSIYDFIEGDR
jgi:hypothetical protein